MTTSLPGHTLKGSSVVYSQGNESFLNILFIICHWLSDPLKNSNHLTCIFETSRGTFRQISKSGFVICSGLFALHQWRLLKRLHQHSAVNQCPRENDWLRTISDEGVNLLCDKFACYVQSLGAWLSFFWKHVLYIFQASVSSIKY